MKKAVLIFTLLTFMVIGDAQGLFTGFLYPVKDNPKIVDQSKALKALQAPDSTFTTSLMRFNFGVSGVEAMWDKANKNIHTETFVKMGFGLSKSFYRVTNGVPYNYMSLNGYVFMPVVDSSNNYSIALTISSFKFFNIEELSPSLGVDIIPRYFKKESQYFPVGLLFNLKYNF